MSGALFAFRVAKPIEYSNEEVLEGEYDPQTQTTVWQGDNQPLGVTCYRTFLGNYSRCRATRNTCCLTGFGAFPGGYACDSFILGRDRYAC
jgi:hypothetical protein